MKVFCKKSIKRSAFDVRHRLPGLYIEFIKGETYEMEILYPFDLKVSFERKLDQVNYRLKDGPVYCDFTRKEFTEHFRSIKYNRKNLIKNIIG